MAKKDKGQRTGAAVTSQMPAPAGGVRMETFIPWTLVRRGVRREVITPLDAPQEFAVEAGRERATREATQDSALIRALGLAHHWQRLLDEGRYRTMTELATAEGMDLGQSSRVAQLVRLAPDVVEACMAAREGGLALEPLVRNKLPALWQAQRAGMAPRFTVPASSPLSRFLASHALHDNARHLFMPSQTPMSKSPGRQARSPAPDASQIKAVRRAMDASHVEQARQRLAALRKTFPGFKPLLGLAWELEDRAGDPMRATARAHEWQRAAPGSHAALEAWAKSTLAAGLIGAHGRAQHRLHALQGHVPSGPDPFITALERAIDLAAA